VMLDAGHVHKAIHDLPMKTKAKNEHRTAYMDYLKVLVSKEELTQEDLKRFEKAIPKVADTSAATASAPLAPAAAATAPTAAGSMIPPVHEAGSSSTASPVQEAHETSFIQEVD